jgi:hypothetical protein
MERALHFGLETTWTFCLSFYLIAISALEEYGNIYNSCIYACREFKQTVTSIHNTDTLIESLVPWSKNKLLGL